MTESEWLVSENPRPMLDHLHGRISPRKLRLFAVGCCRLMWARMSDRKNSEAVEVAERHADGGATERELKAAASRAASAWFVAGDAGWYAWRAAAREAVVAAEWVLWRSGSHTDGVAQAALLRCIAGNPWRPPTLPAVTRTWPVRAVSTAATWGNRFTAVQAVCPWLSPTVLAIARAAYTERRPCGRCGAKGKCDRDMMTTDWHRGKAGPSTVVSTCRACHGAGTDGLLDPVRLAILADALEEAGCQDNDLLQHLRSPGPHVLGCWALDLILRKD